MKTFSFIGHSGSGKTRLIARLIPELRRRGWAVAVIKHCPHGFSLDREGKDSSRFFDVGARSVGLISPRATAVIQRDGNTPDFRTFANRHFQGIDILLIEGGRAGKGIQKIEVLGEQERLRPIRKADERIAVVSDHGGPCGRPVFRHSQVREIAGFLESQPGQQDSRSIRVGSTQK
ncbi:MAG: molybdopterin-guanine dinucleotide biosynthesis protein B [Candidatus Aminicenantales bacterium]